MISGVALPELVAKLHAGNLAPAEVAKAEAANRAEFPHGIPECGSDALRIGLLACMPHHNPAPAPALTLTLTLTLTLALTLTLTLALALTACPNPSP